MWRYIPYPILCAYPRLWRYIPYPILCECSSSSNHSNVHKSFWRHFQFVTRELFRSNTEMGRYDASWSEQIVCNVLQGPGTSFTQKIYYQYIMYPQMLEFNAKTYPVTVTYDLPKILFILFYHVENIHASCCNHQNMTK